MFDDWSVVGKLWYIGDMWLTAVNSFLVSRFPKYYLQSLNPIMITASNNYITYIKQW